MVIPQFGPEYDQQKMRRLGEEIERLGRSLASTSTASGDGSSTNWADLTDVPDFASRWPTWDEIGDLPETFPGDDKSFLDLTDSPSAYLGQGGKFVRVKGDDSGLEFADPGGTSSLPWSSITDVPASLSALESFSGVGLMVRRPDGSLRGRSLLVGSGRLTVSEASGYNSDPLLDLAETAVTAGQYGSTTRVPQFTVDAYGRLTAAADVILDHGALSGLGDDDHTQYHNDARALTWLGTRSTTDLPEGTNLYYTDARVTALVNKAFVDGLGVDHGSLSGRGDDDHLQYHTDGRALTWLGTRSTSDLAEGTNLYYTDVRANAAIDARVTKLFVDGLGVDHGSLSGRNDDDHLQYHTDARALTWLGTRSTDDLPEGLTNLYYTDVRANAAIDARVTKLFVDGLGVDHGSLSGRGDDDHLQYHTDGRALTWLGTRSTSDLAEGTNLYYTDVRANAAIDARVTKPFVDALNVDADTLDGLDSTDLYTRTAIDDLLENYTPVESGFTDRSESTISFDAVTRTFTIAPVGASFEFWSEGNKIVKTAPDTLVIPDVEGIHFFYYDGAGVLHDTQVFSLSIISILAFVATVYWDATNKVLVQFGEERHGRQMDAATHIWAHESFGSQYHNGFQPGGLTIDGNGNLDAHAQLSLTGGSFSDEDITHNVVDGAPQELEPILQAPILYRDGANGDWRIIAATNYPVTTTGTGRAAYNDFDGSTWSVAETGSNDYTLVHLYATNDIRHPIVVVMGQATYNNLGDARTGAQTELNSLQLGQLESIFVEFVPIATLIVKTASSMSNAVKAAFSSTEEGDDYVDWRETTGGGAGSGASASNHSALSGLGNDDHPQYSNIATAETITGAWDFTTHPTGLDHGSVGGLSDDDHTQYHTDARALTWLGTRSTSDLSEGTNLYYTATRANAAIDARVDKTFVDALNVDADTLDGIDSTGFSLSGHDHSGTYQPLDADLTSIAGLAGTSGLLRKTAANTWSLDTNTYLTSFTETDPVFGASPAAGITGTNITNWNTAYGWGDHAGLYSLLGHNHSGTYQPLDADLTSIAGLAGTSGLLRKTAADTWSLDTNTYLTSFTETDPTVGAHIKAITSGQITNWDAAFGWGDHSLAGYLTSYTETDPVFSASPAAGILAGDIINWDAAYSWGDHAGLYEPELGNPAANGYVLSSTTAGVRSWVAQSAGVTDHGALTGLADDDHTQYYNQARGDARYVTLGTTQTITGAKTLTATTTVGPLSGTASGELIIREGGTGQTLELRKFNGVGSEIRTTNATWLDVVIDGQLICEFSADGIDLMSNAAGAILRPKFHTSYDTLAATENNYSSSVYGSLYLTPASGGSTMTGIIGNQNRGALLTIYNKSAADDLTLAHENASSTATARFSMPGAADLVLGPGEGALLGYDSVGARWVMLSAGGSSGGGGGDYLPLSGGTLTGQTSLSGASLTLEAEGTRRLTQTATNPEFIEWAGGTSSFYIGVQDGNGRVQMKWNATEGTSETYLVSSEPAVKWHMDRDTEALAVFTAPAGTAGAGISWTERMRVDTGGIYENGTALSSKYLPLTGGTLTGQLTLTPDTTSDKWGLLLDSSNASNASGFWSTSSGWRLLLRRSDGTMAVDLNPNSGSTSNIASNLTVGGTISENGTALSSKYLPLTGGSMSGYITYENVSSGGWARGLRFDAGGAMAGGIGGLGNGDSITNLYFALGSSPWTSGTGFRISGTTIAMEGALTVNGALTLDGNTIDNAGFRDGIVETNRKGTTAWSGWGMQFSSTAQWAFMGNQTAVGIYDDYNNDWVLRHAENSSLSLYHNGSVKASTQSYGFNVAGELIATNNITAYSDERHKENIFTVPQALDMVGQMRGVYFNRKDDEAKTRRVGVIAQEIQEVLPEVVLDHDDTLSVDYGNIVGVLIEAIKELKTEVELLKARAH